MHSISQPSKISTPWTLRASFTLLAISSSSFLSSFERPTIVTFEPKFANIDANSIPIKPLPIITKCFGKFFRSSKVWLENTFELITSKGVSASFEPLFIMIKSPSIIFFSPLGVVTSTLFSLANEPTPSITSIFSLSFSIA